MFSGERSHKNNIVTIGGGTGNPVSIEALINAGVDYVQAIGAGTDDGGITGRMRIDAHGTKAAYSDLLRSLLALFAPEDLQRENVQGLIELLKLRTVRQQVGYDVVSIISEISDGNPFDKVKEYVEKITGTRLKGEVIPTSLKPTDLCYSTLLGKEYRGESNLDINRMSTDMVGEIWLAPPVPTHEKALETISNADLLVYSCGSLHGSVAVNFIHEGVAETIRNSSAKRVHITNLTSTRNETHNFTPEDFIKFFQKYTKQNHPLDYLVVPEITREEFESDPNNSLVVRTYKAEGSHFLGWDDKMLTQLEMDQDIKVITHKATRIVNGKNSIVRHDPKKLSLSFKEILSRLS